MKTLARADCTTEIVSRLKGLRRDSVPRWGRMSAHQMVCHAADACRMALGEKISGPVGGPVQRTLLRWIALWTPLRWRAGIPTTPELDQECGGTAPGEFASDLAELDRLVKAVAAQPPTTRWPPHPVFGAMSHRAWMRWAYLHLDHHLRQFGA